MPTWVRNMLCVFAALVCVAAGASYWALGEPARNANATLAHAQQQWEVARPHHYLLTVRLITMHGGQMLRLEVRNEQLVEGWLGTNAHSMPATDLQQFGAFVPRQLFVVADKQLDRPTQWRETLVRILPPLRNWLAPACPLRSHLPVSFAAGLGYPKRIFIGTSSCAFDHDGMEVRIDELQPLP